MMKLSFQSILLTWILTTSACDFSPLPRGNVGINLDSTPSVLYFDGGCIPHILNIRGSVAGDLSRISEVRGNVRIFSDTSRSDLMGGQTFAIEIDGEGAFEDPFDFTMREIIGGGESIDEFFGELVVEVYDDSGRVVGEIRRSFTLRRCQPGMDILNQSLELSTRDVYLPQCSPSSVRATLRLSGAISSVASVEMDWTVYDAGSSEQILRVIRPIPRVDRTGDPVMVPMIEFTDEFDILTELPSLFEIPLEPPFPVLPSSDPFATIEVFAWIKAGDGTTISVTPSRRILVHPCTESTVPSGTPGSAKDCPSGTYFAEVTSQCIPIDIPAPGGDGDDGGGDGGSASCSEPCVWSCMASCSCVCP